MVLISKLQVPSPSRSYSPKIWAENWDPITLQVIQDGEI
jgi:hypothetical protein